MQFLDTSHNLEMKIIINWMATDTTKEQRRHGNGTGGEGHRIGMERGQEQGHRMGNTTGTGNGTGMGTQGMVCVTVVGLFFSFSFPLRDLGLLGLSGRTCPFSLFDFFCSQTASRHSFPFPAFSSLTPSIFSICIRTRINTRRAMLRSTASYP